MKKHTWARVGLCCAAVIAGLLLGFLPTHTFGAGSEMDPDELYRSFVNSFSSDFVIDGRIDAVITMPMNLAAPDGDDVVSAAYAVPVTISSSFTSKVCGRDEYCTTDMSMSLLDYDTSYATESYIVDGGQVRTYTHVKSDGDDSYGYWSVRDMYDSAINVTEFLSGCYPVHGTMAVCRGSEYYVSVLPAPLLDSVMFEDFLADCVGDNISFDRSVYKKAVDACEAYYIFDVRTHRLVSAKVTGFEMDCEGCRVAGSVEIRLTGYGTVESSDVALPDGLDSFAVYTDDGIFITNPYNAADDGSDHVSYDEDYLMTEEEFNKKFGPLMVDPETGLPVER